MTKYYSLRDREFDNETYLHSGRNSESLEDLKEAFLSYISADTDEEEIEKTYSKMPIQELADMWEFEIVEHEEKLDEEV